MMKNKLFKAGLAGVAVIALAAGGGTFAAWSDFGNVDDNLVGAGILKLNLTNGDGSAVTPLNFGNLAPGGDSKRAVYVASSDGASVPLADLKLTINNVRDFENGCGSLSEGVVDPSCSASNYPEDLRLNGELSRVLNMRIVSYAAPDALACRGWVGDGADPGPVINSAVIRNEIGNLADPSAVGVPVLISDIEHPLAAGQGVCVTFTSWWPKERSGTVYDSATAPSDNAAQSDSLTFDTRFDLVQH